MPHYLFNTSDNGRVSKDSEGLWYDTPDDMRQSAIRTLPHIALDGLRDGETHEFAIEVSDSAGMLVFRASLAFRSEWIDPSQRN